MPRLKLQNRKLKEGTIKLDEICIKRLREIHYF